MAKGRGGRELIMHRKGLALYPVDPVSEELVMKVVNDRHVIAHLHQPRNAKFSAFVHAVLHKVVQNSDDFDSVDELKKYLKIRTRRYTPIAGVDRTGKPMVYTVLDSTSFYDMDEIEFRGLWDQWLNIILTEILPGVSADALLVNAGSELSPAPSS